MTTVHRPHTEANAVEESVWLAFLAGPTVTAWRPDTARVVVVAPHPDDEVFALGGFIHDVAARGGAVTIVAVTDGEAAHAGQTPPRPSGCETYAPSNAVRRWSVSACRMPASCGSGSPTATSETTRRG